MKSKLLYFIGFYEIFVIEKKLIEFYIEYVRGEFLLDTTENFKFCQGLNNKIS